MNHRPLVRRNNVGERQHSKPTEKACFKETSRYSVRQGAHQRENCVLHQRKRENALVGLECETFVNAASEQFQKWQFLRAQPHRIQVQHLNQGDQQQ